MDSLRKGLGFDEKSIIGEYCELCKAKKCECMNELIGIVESMTSIDFFSYIKLIVDTFVFNYASYPISIYNINIIKNEKEFLSCIYRDYRYCGASYTNYQSPHRRKIAYYQNKARHKKERVKTKGLCFI